MPHLSNVLANAGDRNESIDINFTYQTLPEATITDFERCGDIVEYYLLSFVISCSLQNKWHEVDKLVEHISLEPEAIIRTELISILEGNDINTTDALANNSKLDLLHKSLLALDTLLAEVNKTVLLQEVY